MKLRQLATNVLDILLPRTCVGCGVYGTGACVTCWKKWERPWVESWTTHGIQTVVSAGAYRDLFIQQVIQRWKFSGDRSVAHLVGKQLGAVVREQQLRWSEPSTVLVPIPLHTRKFRERGFNQTEDLAQVFGSELGCSVVPLLQRIKYTKPQKSLDEQEKSKNLSRAFQIDQVGAAQVNRSTHVVILDDITTTGTTLREAATVLRQAGFTSISAVVVARG